MNVEKVMEGIATLQLDSFLQLTSLAQDLGPVRTRLELIPLLCRVQDDDPSYLLIILAHYLGNFIPLVGGIDHGYVLLIPLENICTAENNDVREKVMESLCTIGSQLREEHSTEYFIPLVKRLATAEQIWSTARATSCGLFHIAYANASVSLQNELKTLYIKLCRDPSNRVREAAAIKIGKFAATIEQPHTQKDEHSVGISAVKGGCSASRKLLEPQELVVEHAQDEYWGVFPMIPEELNELCKAVGPDATRTDLVSAYLWLLCDDDDEVRRAAAGQLNLFCQMLSPELLFKKILSCVMVFSLPDPSQYAVSARATYLVFSLGKICMIMHREQLALSWVLDCLMSCWRTRLKFASEQSNRHPIEHLILVDKFTFLVVSMLLSLCDNDESLLGLISSKVICSDLFKVLARAERFIVRDDVVTSEVLRAEKQIGHGDVVKGLHEFLTKVIDYQFTVAFKNYVFLFDGINFF
ncbi:hypothetical protein KY289_018386 [Solanum tuberosum]|nr:hypothetical protein KY289_018386 [Solanum tuberosum]